MSRLLVKVIGAVLSAVVLGGLAGCQTAPPWPAWDSDFPYPPPAWTNQVDAGP